MPLIYLNNLIGAENWGKGVDQLGYSRAINRQKFDYEALIKNLEDPNSRQHKIYQGYKRLLKIRTAEPLFSPLVAQNIIEIDKRVLAIHRHNDKDNLIALTSVSDKTIKIHTNKITSLLGQNPIQNIITNKTIELKSTIELKPYEVLWIK